MVFSIHAKEKKVVLAGGLLVCVAAGYIYWRRIKYNQKKGRDFSLNMIEALQKPWVHIQNPEKVERIIRNMMADGTDHLQVISDFDRTLSGYKKNGHTIDTCHQALDHGSVLPADYREKACHVRDTYYPIEIDPSLTIDEKIPYMVEWWTKAHNLLVQCNFTRTTLKAIVSDSNIEFRDGCVDMFESLCSHHVPLLVFSAGVGDIIEEVFKQQIKLYENIVVVSNYMDFNSQGQLVGFQGEMIHTFNKNKCAIHNSDYFHKIKTRGNLLLLGDSLGDLTMAEGACDVKNILKIGFLNDKVDQMLETYKSKYDIVLVSDETMDVPNAILSKIY